MKEPGPSFAGISKDKLVAGPVRPDSAVQAANVTRLARRSTGRLESFVQVETRFDARPSSDSASFDLLDLSCVALNNNDDGICYQLAGVRCKAQTVQAEATAGGADGGMNGATMAVNVNRRRFATRPLGSEVCPATQRPAANDEPRFFRCN